MAACLPAASGTARLLPAWFRPERGVQTPRGSPLASGERLLLPLLLAQQPRPLSGSGVAAVLPCLLETCLYGERELTAMSAGGLQQAESFQPSFTGFLTASDLLKEIQRSFFIVDAWVFVDNLPLNTKVQFFTDKRSKKNMEVCLLIVSLDSRVPT